jgi:redox-sensitive bicupin YhaK (pirin superfamily)
MDASPGSAILSVRPLGFVWETADPFLFCVHHDDRYPAGNERLGPAASLAGRNLGSDFEPRDGWRMYHGEVVPGFPAHPHRGFETVTLVRRGYIDHSDSLGAVARFGGGDVQWLTAGRGIVHSEMFPLLQRDQPNPVELFQIWLNLPAEDKMAEPHFTMLWADQIPTVRSFDAEGRETAITVVAGSPPEAPSPPSPPPRSWASRPEAEVAIWTIRLSPQARTTLPPASPGVNRTVYVVSGTSARVDGKKIAPNHAVRLRADVPVSIEAGSTETELLMLQGRPIGQPVAQHGPFVMNTRAELEQAYADYRRTQFGGWPWSRTDPTHPSDERRFARRTSGAVERPIAPSPDEPEARPAR